MKKTIATVCSISFLLSGCVHFFPQIGPTTAAIKNEFEENRYITLVELDPQLVTLFQPKGDNYERELQTFLTEKYTPVINAGDVIEINIYETPPAVLFTSQDLIPTSSGVSSFSVPPQMVDDRGYITVPFVGRIKVKEKRPEEVAQEIEKALSEKAHKPQVVVRILNFTSSFVSVFGQVKESKKVPLTYTNTTLLDVLSSAGGVTSPINKTLIQVDRNGHRIFLPLELIMKDPKYNIYLKPGDIVTVIYKTQYATFLGASGRNEDLEFEAMGISLAQALGRVGGLKEDTAHAKGLFVFRFEDKDILEKAKIPYKAYTKKDDKVPVVYNIDLSKPESLFVLKKFTLKDGDLVYIATAPSVQLQKFLQFVSSTIQPVFMIERMGK